jgi:hypothetical protein
MNNDTYWNSLLEKLTEKERAELLPLIQEIDQDRGDGFFRKIMLLLKAHSAQVSHLQQKAVAQNDQILLFARKIISRINRLRFFRLTLMLLWMVVCAGGGAGALYLWKSAEFYSGQAAKEWFDVISKHNLKIGYRESEEGFFLKVDGPPGFVAKALPAKDPITGIRPPMEAVEIVVPKAK